MRLAQRLIKAFAICLAGLIIVVIVASALGMISLVGMLTGADEHTPGEMSTVWQEGAENTETVSNLEVSIGATTLYVVSSEEKNLRIETNNDYIESWQGGKTLHVVEKSHLYLTSLFSDGDMTIYVPKGMDFDSVDIDAGAGTLRIERMVANKLNLTLGAGKTSIDYLKVYDSARIDGGAGLTEITYSELRNLKLELGVGKTQIKSKLRGESKIDSGVGKLELDLVGSSADYKVTINKGIGSVLVNGEKMKDGATYGQGRNDVKIDAGVGAVEIRTVAE